MVRRCAIGVNIQNLGRSIGEVSKKLDLAISLVKAKDLTNLRKEFKSEPLEIIGSLVRSCLVAAPGKKLIVADANAIENRVLGWLARDNTILEVFKQGKCPYLSFACVLYNQNYDDLYKAYKSGDPEAKLMRQNSKPAVLGAGYQLSSGEEIITEEGDKIFTGLMGYSRALGIELPQELADKSIQIFRDTHKGVKQFWSDLESAAIKCVKTRQNQVVGYLTFHMIEDVLCMRLPSGRDLHYVGVSIVKRDWYGKQKDALEIYGMDQKTHIWNRTFTYSGKLAENGTQAVSRDILLSGALNAEKASLPIIYHCHDELVSEKDINSLIGLKELCACMVKKPWWADDLLFLAAEGYEDKIYRKE